MRRLQVIEAMNYCEARGFPYLHTWSPTTQHEMRLSHSSGAEVIGYLEERGMPVEHEASYRGVTLR